MQRICSMLVATPAVVPARRFVTKNVFIFRLYSTNKTTQWIFFATCVRLKLCDRARQTDGNVGRLLSVRHELRKRDQYFFLHYVVATNDAVGTLNFFVIDRTLHGTTTKSTGTMTTLRTRWKTTQVFLTAAAVIS